VDHYGWKFWLAWLYCGIWFTNIAIYVFDIASQGAALFTDSWIITHFSPEFA
jgi:hypothetical protein